MKFHKHFFRASRALPCGQKERQTDRYDNAKSRFPQCSNRPETTVSTDEVPDSRSSHFIPGDRFPTTHCMGECVDLSQSRPFRIEKSLLPSPKIQRHFLCCPVRNLITKPTDYPISCGVKTCSLITHRGHA